MKKMLATAVLGAAIASSPALAQEQGGRHGGMGEDMSRSHAQQMADNMFQRFDTNHDGTLTRDEAEQAMAQFGGHGGRMLDRIFGNAQSLTLQQAEAQALAHFDAMDLNHDGVVTQEEGQQARAQAKAVGAGTPPGVPAAPAPVPQNQ